MRDTGVILLLENSTDYLFLLDQAFRNHEGDSPLRVARYGNEAILYLKGIGIYGNRQHYPLPGLIIIDLTIPDGSGLAVLGWIRRQENLNSVPVILLVPPSKDSAILDHLGQTENVFSANRNEIDSLVKMIHYMDMRPSMEVAEEATSAERFLPQTRKARVSPEPGGIISLSSFQ